MNGALPSASRGRTCVGDHPRTSGRRRFCMEMRAVPMPTSWREGKLRARHSVPCILTYTLCHVKHPINDPHSSLLFRGHERGLSGKPPAAHAVLHTTWLDTVHTALKSTAPSPTYLKGKSHAGCALSSTPLPPQVRHTRKAPPCPQRPPGPGKAFTSWVAPRGAKEQALKSRQPSSSNPSNGDML